MGCAPSPQRRQAAAAERPAPEQRPGFDSLADMRPSSPDLGSEGGGTQPGCGPSAVAPCGSQSPATSSCPPSASGTTGKRQNPSSAPSSANVGGSGRSERQQAGGSTRSDFYATSSSAEVSTVCDPVRMTAPGMGQVVYPAGVVVQAGRRVDSRTVGTLALGAMVMVSEVCGERLRLSGPVAGWVTGERGQMVFISLLDAPEAAHGYEQTSQQRSGPNSSSTSKNSGPTEDTGYDHDDEGSPGLVLATLGRVGSPPMGKQQPNHWTGRAQCRRKRRRAHGAARNERSVGSEHAPCPQHQRLDRSVYCAAKTASASSIRSDGGQTGHAELKAAAVTDAPPAVRPRRPSALRKVREDRGPDAFGPCVSPLGTVVSFSQCNPDFDAVPLGRGVLLTVGSFLMPRDAIRLCAVCSSWRRQLLGPDAAPAERMWQAHIAELSGPGGTRAAGAPVRAAGPGALYQRLLDLVNPVTAFDWSKPHDEGW
eukprot:TRINITY_DN18195_c0_g1_i1.p1 TRINITY_DN18195_c0_g1~~TRINITY_DN18195_c0_g1_i1.p1  ORF type:complete len:514 (+),score=104.25 TRINITY_DN18195_c0_g1_i1:102-1544(+)